MAVRLLDRRQLDDARAQIGAAPRIALDTEFHGERGYLPDLYLVQVHVPGADSWIIDPLQLSLLAGLADVLTQDVEWLVHAGFQDLRLMQRALEADPPFTLDTQIAAGLCSPVYPAGLAALCREWLDVELDKGETLSDWSKRPLNPDQIRYAADDVALLPRLWAQLEAKLVALDRVEVARGACAEARHQALHPADPDTLWRHLPQAASLVGVDARVFADLVAWRERQAASEDRPTRSIVGDGTLKQLSRSKPGDRAALQGNRRLSKRLLSKYGDTILGIIAEAVQSDPDSWPTPVRKSTPEARAVDWLGLMGDAEGAARSYATRLVLPKSVREDLVLHGRPTRPTIASTLGTWRDALVGDTIDHALAGNISLHLTPPDSRLDAGFSRG